MRFAPKPVQDPHPPIWVGGRSDAALRRAVRFGAAWHPTQMALDALVERMSRLNELSSEVGRPIPPATTIHQSVAFEEGVVNPGERRIGRGSPTEVAEDLSAYTQMDIAAVVCNFRAVDTDAQRRAMETFASQVMPSLKE